MAGTERGIGLGADLRREFRMLAEHGEDPRQGGRQTAVGREEEVEQLNFEFGRRQLLAIGSTRALEHAERGARAVLRNLVLEIDPQAITRPDRLAVRGERQVDRRRERALVHDREVVRPLDVARRGVARREQHVRDVEAELGQIAGHGLLALTDPLVDEALDHGEHARQVALHRLIGERREQQSLAGPVAIAIEERHGIGMQQFLEELRRAVLPREVLRIHEEGERPRAGKEHDRVGEKPRLPDVPVPFRARQRERERILEERQGFADQRRAQRSRRWLTHGINRYEQAILDRCRQTGHTFSKETSHR